jgi:hypothetical protein
MNQAKMHQQGASACRFECMNRFDSGAGMVEYGIKRVKKALNILKKDALGGNIHAGCRVGGLSDFNTWV